MVCEHYPKLQPVVTKIRNPLVYLYDDVFIIRFRNTGYVCLHVLFLSKVVSRQTVAPQDKLVKSRLLIHGLYIEMLSFMNKPICFFFTCWVYQLDDCLNSLLC